MYVLLLSEYLWVGKGCVWKEVVCWKIYSPCYNIHYYNIEYM